MRFDRFSWHNSSRRDPAVCDMLLTHSMPPRDSHHWTFHSIIRDISNWKIFLSNQVSIKVFNYLHNIFNEKWTKKMYFLLLYYYILLLYYIILYYYYYIYYLIYIIIFWILENTKKKLCEIKMSLIIYIIFLSKWKVNEKNIFSLK